MKKYVKITSLLVITLLMLQIMFPVIINVDIDTSYAATEYTYGGVTYTYNGTNTLTITGSGTVSSNWKTSSTLNAPKANITKIIFNSENITAIGSNAFSDCTALTTVTYTKQGITSIGSSAFSNCTSLTTITIPNTVTAIGSYAFKGCTALKTLTFSGNTATTKVETIGNSAFYNCSSLATINIIPVSVKRIEDYAFYGCSALKTLKTGGGNNCVYYGNYSFSGTGITKVENVAPDAIIGTNAFPTTTTVSRSEYLGMTVGCCADNGFTRYVTRNITIKSGDILHFKYNVYGCPNDDHMAKGAITVELIDNNGNILQTLINVNPTTSSANKFEADAKPVSYNNLPIGTYTIKFTFKGMPGKGGGGGSCGAKVYDFGIESPKTYSVTYNGNGHTGGSTASQTKTEDISLSLRSNGFTKTGYTFQNWNTSASGTGTTYYEGSTYSSNNNLNLYAQWKINTSTLKINPNGGTWNNITEVASFTENYNKKINIPIPIREGYRFMGWTRTNQYGSLPSTTTDTTYTFGATNGVTDTITANWKIAYQLVIEPNGGIWEESSENQTTSMIERETKEIRFPRRNGYTFAGWVLKGTGSSIALTEENKDLFTMGNEDAVLTADWERNHYELEVKPNGGTWEEKEEDQTFSLLYEGTKEIKHPTRNGYTFVGWTLNGEETGSKMSSLTEDQATFTMDIKKQH